MALEAFDLGVMARTNLEIREAARRHDERKAQQHRLRRPIALIDRMLDGLEDLNIHEIKRVPTSYEHDLEQIRALVRDLPAASVHHEGLKVRIGVLRLMDVLYAVQDTLLIAQRGRPLSRRARHATGEIQVASDGRAPRVRLMR